MHSQLHIRIKFYCSISPFNQRYNNRQNAGYGGPYNVPWYLYGMKFGIIGIFGLAFILSYLFKRFEKEIFVFGIIIVIALFAGPYYDEHRFSKYIMVVWLHLRHLLVYRILNDSKME